MTGTSTLRAILMVYVKRDTTTLAQGDLQAAGFSTATLQEATQMGYLHQTVNGETNEYSLTAAGKNAAKDVVETSNKAMELDTAAEVQDDGPSKGNPINLDIYGITEITAYGTNDGEVFTCAEDAIKHVCTKRFRDEVYSRFNITNVDPESVISWIDANAEIFRDYLNS